MESTSTCTPTLFFYTKAEIVDDYRSHVDCGWRGDITSLVEVAVLRETDDGESQIVGVFYLGGSIQLNALCVHVEYPEYMLVHILGAFRKVKAHISELKNGLDAELPRDSKTEVYKPLSVLKRYEKK